MRQLRYFLDASWQNFKGNLFLNTLTVASSAVAFFILFLGLLVFQNLKQIVFQSAMDGTVSVFAKEGLPDKELKQIRQRLESLAVFADITYVSPARARDIFITRYQDLAPALDELGFNPFPPSFVGKLAKDQRQSGLTKALGALRGFPGVAAVESGGASSGRRSYLMRIGRLVAGLVMFSLLISVLFLIANTIKLNIYNRREKISILRLVGATDNFVRAPFLLEGSLQSLSAGVLALGMLLVFYLTFFTRALSHLRFIIGGAELAFFDVSTILQLLAGAWLLGLLASFAAVGRFLEGR